jgi:hypothetical protein
MNPSMMIPRVALRSLRLCGLFDACAENGYGERIRRETGDG